MKIFFKRAGVLCLLVILLPAISYAEIYSGSCGQDVEWKLDTETGLLEIYNRQPGAYSNMVSSGYAPWYSYTKHIRSVNLSGISNICSYAFYNCSSLTSVSIPESVTSIGYRAFSGCSGLTSVTIPESVTSIGESAFSGCSGLTSVTIPESVTSIGYRAFSGCSGLTSVTIPESVTSIGIGAFANCSGLTSITIPESVTSIGESAFSGCYFLRDKFINKSVLISENNWGATFLDEETGEGLLIKDHIVVKCRSWASSVCIPEGVTSIGSSAFSGCSGLTSITIPEGVTSIGSSAFSGCSGLNTIIIKQGNPKYDSRDDCNAIIETNTNTLLWGCNTTTIPESVTSIGGSAFSGCSGLTSVTIPESVTSIGQSAFSGCSGLTSITIPESVTSIGGSAFSGCSGLTSVTIPESVNSIGSSAFASCNNLTSVTINSNAITSAKYSSEKNLGTIFGAQVKEYIIGGSKIGDYAFYNCSGLESITILESVTSIGRYAFSSCSGLTSVTIPEGVTSIGDGAFSSCSGLTSVTIPESVTSISSSAFYKCSGLTSVELNSSAITSATYSSSNNIGTIFGSQVKKYILGGSKIGGYAFYDCSGLESVTLSDNVTSIGEWAFYGCSGLTSITIPESVTSIGSNTFYGCSGLNTIIVKQWNPKYDSRDDCNAIIETNTNTLLYGCNTTTIPESVISIGEYAFYRCSGLTSITIPGKVTSIESSAFSGCSNLTSVTLNSNAIASALYSSTKNIGTIFGSQVKYLTLGDEVKRIGEYAFASSKEVVSIVLGRNIERIQDYAFSGCDKLEEVRVKASEPPIAFSTAFPDNAYYAVLYVPEGTEALYKEDNVWGKFARIRTFKDEPEKCVLSIKSAIGGYLEMICNTQTSYTFRIITEKGWQVSSVSFNGVDVTGKITDDSYTTPLLEGDAELSVVFEMDEDEIDMVNEVGSHSQLRVSASASTIYIHNDGDPVNSYIYTTDGIMVKSVVASYGKTVIPVQPDNVYVVKVNNRTFKVAL